MKKKLDKLPDRQIEILEELDRLAKAKIRFDQSASAARKYTNPGSIRRRKELERFRDSLVSFLESHSYPVPIYLERVKAREDALIFEGQVDTLANWILGQGPRAERMFLTNKVTRGLQQRGVRLTSLQAEQIRKAFSANEKDLPTVEHLKDWAAKNFGGANNLLAKTHLKIELAHREAMLAWYNGKGPMPDKEKLRTKFDKELRKTRTGKRWPTLP